MSSVESITTLIPGSAWPRILAIVAAALVLLAYKLASRYVTRLSRRLRFEAHVVNAMRLVLRIVAGLVLLGILSSIYGVPVSVFLGGSALLGTVIGFGSSQTINNLVAGFYVMVTRPFAVKDYVRIGDVEGQVEEMTFNYTKLYTPSKNLMSIPNIQVLNSRIINCIHEGLIKYSFSIGLPHDMHIDRLTDKCLEPAIEEFHNQFQEDLIRKPEYFIEPPEPGRRAIKIRLFVPKGEANRLYLLQPELMRRIVALWDAETGKGR